MQLVQLVGSGVDAQVMQVGRNRFPLASVQSRQTGTLASGSCVGDPGYGMHPALGLWPVITWMHLRGQQQQQEVQSMLHLLGPGCRTRHS